MRKKKQYNLFNKIRNALRDLYRYSPMRKEAIKQAQFVAGKTTHYYAFICPICKIEYPIQMADVDHEPPLGPLEYFYDESCPTDPKSLGVWGQNLFYGSVQVICKICHKQKTASQRKRSK